MPIRFSFLDSCAMSLTPTEQLPFNLSSLSTKWCLACVNLNALVFITFSCLFSILGCFRFCYFSFSSLGFWSVWFFAPFFRFSSKKIAHTLQKSLVLSSPIQWIYFGWSVLTSQFNSHHMQSNTSVCVCILITLATNQVTKYTQVHLCLALKTVTLFVNLHSSWSNNFHKLPSVCVSSNWRSFQLRAMLSDIYSSFYSVTKMRAYLRNARSPLLQIYSCVFQHSAYW